MIFAAAGTLTIHCAAGSAHAAGVTNMLRRESLVLHAAGDLHPFLALGTPTPSPGRPAAMVNIRERECFAGYVRKILDVGHVRAPVLMPIYAHLT